MSGPSSSSPRPRRERGGVSWVTLLLLVLVAGTGYLGWMWVPLYFEHYTVKQVVRDYMNQAIKNRDDDGLRRNMVLKIRSLAQVDGVDVHGRVARVPAILLDERQVAWERDLSARPPLLRVAFDYERAVRYPGIERTETKLFTVDLTNDMSLPEWGPAR
jgi:hypothetical protein